MPDLSAYDGIIFDMDGTLVDSMGVHIDAWEIVCQEFNYPFDRQYMHGLGGVPTKRTVEMLNELHGNTHQPELVAERKRQIFVAMNHIPELIAETMAVFNRYRPIMPIGIGTGAERPNAEHLLTHHGLLERLDALVTASDVTHGKPHPETFLMVAQKMGVEPSKCIVFEDTTIGAQAAQSAGMDCILVNDGKIQI
ncbi:HAD family hydrolase [Aliiglaciecola lipolytica]|uniref:Beta-phosphoglucomutase family hydrolase n=1 Tax=Aliiglaciecola lipolytica E3 TaxID=1127673 RepID=K6X794_9ALTE|nr:beta-phosphoglucomutase family hydrolase [Aliiglaciecola lipolytica]GAC16479.1 hypothetical protein GLIP_3868 [Aliiglaciecola lipolytica E3]